MLWTCNPAWQHCHMATPNKKPTDPNREALGRLIREKRDAAEISQTDLANEMGNRIGGKFYQTTIGRIENGERSVSLTEAAVLSGILDIPIATLAHYAAPPTPQTLRHHYAHKIMDATRALDDARLAVRSARIAAENLSDLPPRQVAEDTPRGRKTIEGLPGEIFAYEAIESSLEDYRESIHKFWLPWMFGEINAAPVESGDQDDDATST